MRVFLVVFVALTSAYAWIPMDDPCSIVPSRLPGGGETVTVTAKHECAKGEIRWDYPQGTFTIIFNPPHTDNFRLCLKEDHANFIKEMYAVVGTTKDQIQAPTEGHDACVSSHDGEVHLELVAPPTRYYVTMIPFTVSLT